MGITIKVLKEVHKTKTKSRNLELVFTGIQYNVMSIFNKNMH